MPARETLIAARGLLPEAATQPVSYTGYVYGMVSRHYSVDEADEALDCLGYRVTGDATLVLRPPATRPSARHRMAPVARHRPTGSAATSGK